MISFNEVPVLGNEIQYIQEAIDNRKLCGDGPFTKKCSLLIEKMFNVPKTLLTTSCTHALEMSAILVGIKQGDEVIMPSYTFVSTANAFVRAGAKIVFIDVRQDTMNMDENLIEAAITNKTKAIVVVHYAGVACEMNRINEIARQHNLIVIEDAAQGVYAKYEGKALGTLADIGCFSFHETKNYVMGEGGAILLNHKSDIERAEIIREKGTNRSKFYRGEIDKYTWIDCGSSYLPSELNVAYLYAQLEQADVINDKRVSIWNRYHTNLEELQKKERIIRPYVPNGCEHNGHMYYIRVKDLEERTKMLQYLKQKNILATFHYVPLHSSVAGKKWGRFNGEDRYTTRESDRLIRLPLYYNLSMDDVDRVISCVYDFFTYE